MMRKEQASFGARLTLAIQDPGRVSAPGTPATMLRDLSMVVIDCHRVDTDGTCVGHFDSREEQREWPCDEIIRMGRIYGVRWTHP